MLAAYWYAETTTVRAVSALPFVPQVSSSCQERGEVILELGARYRELSAAAFSNLFLLQQEILRLKAHREGAWNKVLYLLYTIYYLQSNLESRPTY